jgi:hypothetical protein
MRLALAPCSLRDANAFVQRHHRHHGPVVGAKFAVAAVLGRRVVGVAVAGRPVARMLDDGRTLEVTRVATDGTRNACSLLYGAARRAARALGYARIITYTRATEDGASLRASGWAAVVRVEGRSWSCPSRRRRDKHAIEDRVRWECPLEP